MTLATERRVALALGVALGVHLSALAQKDEAAVSAIEGAVDAAIVQAVHQRMGDDMQVRISRLRVDAAESTRLRVVPDVAARTGRLARFVVLSNDRRVGEAVAQIDLSGPHVRARRPVARGVSLVVEDLEAVVGDLPSIRFERLPTATDAVGQRVRRAIGVGEVITGGIAALPDAVRSGDEVKALVRVGGVEAWGTGRAWGSGRVGDVIRLSRGSMRPVGKARVIAPGIVEVVP